MKSLVAPFDSYKGDKPYIFVSYAHRNSRAVYRYITRLRDEGFRIWYDEGIDPGTDWSDEIGKALDNMTSFLVFVSPAMVNSNNVKKEIVYAQNRKKQMIAVHIVDTVLPPGLELQLSNIQALLVSRFNNKEKFFERLFAALPPETREAKETQEPPPQAEPARKPARKHARKPFSQELKKRFKTLIWILLSLLGVLVFGFLLLSRPHITSDANEDEKESKNIFGQLFRQSSEKISRVEEEEGVISFFPSGTLTIKTLSGEEYKAMLNTVTGFPVSIYKEGTEYKLELENFTKANFAYQLDEEEKNLLTIRTYDAKGKETVVIESYAIRSYSKIGTISFLTTTGLRFLSLDQVVQMTKDEAKTLEMPKNTRYMYINSEGMVYKIPQSLLKYEYVSPGQYSPSKSVFYGIPHFGGDIFRTNSLKYIRVCKEVDEFKKSNNRLYVNVYFTDNSMMSTSLLCDGYYNSSIVAPTVLGEIRALIHKVDEIFFGNYDVDFANKVASDAWDGSKTLPFKGKGTATVLSNNGSKTVLALNTLVAVGSAGRRTSSHPTTYLKSKDEMYNADVGTDILPLFWEDMKSMKVKKNDKKFTAEYLLHSGEKGEKSIFDYHIQGLVDNVTDVIKWDDIEKIDFDNNRNVDLSRFKKAIIACKNGCSFETLQATLYFRYSSSSGGIPSFSNSQTVNIEGGLTITYDKIKKIEFLPIRDVDEKKKYPVKITLQAGAPKEFMLDVAGYYWSYLQLLTPAGVFDLNLRSDIEYIEFL